MEISSKKNQVMTICSGVVEFSFKKKETSKAKKLNYLTQKLYAIYIPKIFFIL